VEGAGDFRYLNGVVDICLDFKYIIEVYYVRLRQTYSYTLIKKTERV